MKQLQNDTMLSQNWAQPACKLTFIHLSNVRIFINRNRSIYIVKNENVFFLFRSLILIKKFPFLNNLKVSSMSLM